MFFDNLLDGPEDIFTGLLNISIRTLSPNFMNGVLNSPVSIFSAALLSKEDDPRALFITDRAASDDVPAARGVSLRHVRSGQEAKVHLGTGIGITEKCIVVMRE